MQSKKQTGEIKIIGDSSDVGDLTLDYRDASHVLCANAHADSCKHSIPQGCCGQVSFFSKREGCTE